jgi:hypothetical protein
MRALADGRFEAQRDDLHRDLVRRLGAIDQDHLNRGFYRSSIRLSVRLEARRSYLRSVLACKIRSAVESHELAGVHFELESSQALQSDLRRIYEHELEATLDDGRKQCENSGGGPRLADQFLNAVRRDCSREFERAAREATAEIARLELMRMRQAQTPGDVASPHPLKPASSGSQAGDLAPSQATPFATAGSGSDLKHADSSSPSPSNSGTIDASGPSTPAADESRDLALTPDHGMGRDSRLGASPTIDNAPTDESCQNVFRRESDFWLLRFAGKAERVVHIEGMPLIARLLQTPGQSVKCEDLPIGGVGLAGADEVLDEVGVQRVRQRVARIDHELVDARDNQERSLVTELESEKSRLTDSLMKAHNLSGNRRLLGSETERVSGRVGRNIKTALRHIESVHPILAAHLRQSLLTPFGRAPKYEPQDECSWLTR